MTVGVLVPAAGRGERLGAGVAKAMRPIRGEPLVAHAVRTLLAAPSVSAVVVAAPPEDADAMREVLVQLFPGAGASLRVVAGRDTRQESVAAALTALPDDVDIVLVHDAARAVAPVDLVERVVASVRANGGAVVPCLPVRDTVRTASGAPADRNDLQAVQTPQGFVRAQLEDAHRRATAEHRVATDDAALVEAVGGTVTVVEGSEEAFKVTTPIDLLLAQAILDLRAGAR
jgi:2-C-methyl-D-erythritol 4-phosphate cytidylyltransferase